jgi:hypothetical protein
VRDRVSIFHGIQQNRYGGFQAGATEAPASRKTLSALSLDRLKRLAVFGALLLVAVWGYNAMFGGFPFPDYVSASDRVPRVDSEFADSGADIVEDMIAATGIKVDIEYAFYGSEEQLRYMIFAVDSGEDAVRQALESQRPRKRGAIECVTNGVDSLCYWTQGETLVGLYGWSEAERVLEVVAKNTRLNTA